MRKFMMSGAVLSSLFGVVPLIRRTSNSNRRWVVALMWAAWLIGVVVAVVGVIDEEDDKGEILP